MTPKLTQEQRKNIELLGFKINGVVALESDNVCAYPWPSMTISVFWLANLLDHVGVQVFLAYQTTYDLNGPTAAKKYWRSAIPAELDFEVRR